MIANVLLLIAVGVHLTVFVDGNCTTELSETDVANETSLPGDDDLGVGDGGTVMPDAFGTLPEYDYSEIDKKRFDRGANDQTVIVDAGPLKVNRSSDSLNLSLKTGRLSFSIDVTKNQSLGSNSTDGGDSEKTAKDVSITYSVKVDPLPKTNENRFCRDSNCQIIVEDASSDKAIEGAVSPGTVIQADDSTSTSNAIRNSSLASDSDESSDSSDEPAVIDHSMPSMAGSDLSSPPVPIAAMLFKRFYRDVHDQELDSGPVTFKVIADPTVTPGLLLDIQPSTSTFAPEKKKKKLKRFPSLQYIAKLAILEINGGYVPEKPQVFRTSPKKISEIYKREVPASPGHWFKRLFN